jgi:hypothetical protein
MLAEAATAVSSIKAAYDIAKGVQALATSTEVRQATSEMLDALLTARERAFAQAETEAALLDKIRGLEGEVGRLKAWDREDERYELKRFHPGTYAYVLKPEMARGEPPQRLCQPCYDKRVKGVLYAGDVERGLRTYHCPSCLLKISIGSEMPSDGSEG